MVDARTGSVEFHRQIDSTCDRFETAWCQFVTNRRQQGQPQLEDYLDGVVGPSSTLLFAELLKVELNYLRQLGSEPDPRQYMRRFPAVPEPVIIGAYAQSDEDASVSQTGTGAGDESPTIVGGYRIVEEIGRGGFGTVYRGHDDVLNRNVAIKMLQPSSGRAVDSFLAEGRALARLRHPNIVTIYKVGTTEAGQWYIATELIEGTNLAAAIERRGIESRQAASLIATIAGALHYSHTRGVVHRDVKPANILLDASWCPYLADFGLALNDAEHWFTATEGGTLAYMSPEQARGEGHLVDRRSDVFSLGVVLYELLTGCRPFTGETWQETLERLTRFDPHPPRMLNESVPPELEQICLKAMAKRAADRYETAEQMAADIDGFLRAEADSSVNVEPAAGPDTPLRIVPKGLRSFDARDASFFLDLVPGPRDGAGLPDSVSFWKHRIESRRGASFRVGVLYGPSGTGKSSLVKAGLLPRLTQAICPIYVEATVGSTESTLLAEVRKRFPELASDPTLPSTLHALRTAPTLRAGTKVLIVLDQFEQWLHGTGAHAEDSELALALRQCDGERIQCLILIRDEFWTPISRFMTGLEAPIVDGQNARAAEYFDPRHACRVLTAIGQAYHCLPTVPAQINEQQHTFLEKVVADLARDERVAPVQLTLFCELAKSKPWDMATYRAFGGAEGAGMQYLERTFASETAPTQHRAHLPAVLAVLGTLLPEQRGDLKGPVRTHAELFHASGYQAEPDRFRELLHILDHRLRLISPSGCDTINQAETPDDTPAAEDGQVAARQYQLTHDYLIPSVRMWLNSKRLATRRGRAQALLDERTRYWDALRPNRYLPTLYEFVQIRLWTRSLEWTTKQRSLMSTAGRHHVLRLIGVCLLALLFMVVRDMDTRAQVDEIVEELMTADVSQVPALCERLEPFGQIAMRRLLPLISDFDLQKESSLRVVLALSGLDAGWIRGYYPELVDDLWHIVAPEESANVPPLQVDRNAVPSNVHRPEHDAIRVLQAAAALIQLSREDIRLSREDKRWKGAGAMNVARQLSMLSELDLLIWREVLEPGRRLLLPSLLEIYSDPGSSNQQHVGAIYLITLWGKDDRDIIVRALLQSDGKEESRVLIRLISDHLDWRNKLKVVWQGLATKDAPKGSVGDIEDEFEERTGRTLRRDLLAVALFKLGDHEPLRQSLANSEADLTLANLLVNQLARHDCDPRIVAKLLEESIDQRWPPREIALLCQAFGEFSNEISRSEFKRLWPKLRPLLNERSTDCALHSSVEWLFRRWDRQDQIDDVYGQLKRDSERSITDGVGWYINGERQKMVIMTASDFLMGAPESEESLGRKEDEEALRWKRINRRFAISAHEVTRAQYEAFLIDLNDDPRSFFQDAEAYARVSWDPRCPVSQVNWYQAAQYCNWLSDRAGLPRCYRTTGQKNDGVDEMELIPGSLSRGGYRLPTDAEWEFACRAGGQETWSFGHDTSLLPYYAWFEDHPNAQLRSEPVGMLKPNMFGLFDMHGNLWEWTSNWDRPVRRDPDSDEIPVETDQEDLDSRKQRIRRGNSFQGESQKTRSANRSSSVPEDNSKIIGFRVARTISLIEPGEAWALYYPHDCGR